MNRTIDVLTARLRLCAVECDKTNAGCAFKPLLLEAADMIDKLFKTLIDEIEWQRISEESPPPFTSVLGYFPEQAPFTTVRECYLARDGKFKVPALLIGETQPNYWREMPKDPKEVLELIWGKEDASVEVVQDVHSR